MFHKNKSDAAQIADKLMQSDGRLAYTKVELEPGKGWVVVACPNPYQLKQSRWEKIATRAKAEELVAELLTDPKIANVNHAFAADKGWVVTVEPRHIDVDDLLATCEIRDPITGRSRRLF